MNVKFIILLSLISFSSFAGILENRATGERLYLSLDKNRNELVIESTSANVFSKTIVLQTIKQEDYSVDYYKLTKKICSDMYFYWYEDHNAGCILVPILNIPGLVVGTLDTIAVPFKATANFIKNMKAKKDFNKLIKAINYKNIYVVRVSNGRFRRIEKLIEPTSI